MSVNGAMVACRPELALSTIAHEIGHIVFDVPSTVDQPARRYRAVTSGPDCLSKTQARSERRANEFMGALLAPRALLHRELVRRAISLKLPLVDVGEDQPVLRSKADPMRVEELLLDLAERFGVSASLIEYRLHRYDLVLESPH